MKHFETELDAALGRAPEVQAPRNFSQRLIARLPDEAPVAAQSRRTWQLPALAGLVAALLGALAFVALQSGFDQWLARPAIFLCVLASVSAMAVVWVWRIVISG